MPSKIGKSGIGRLENWKIENWGGGVEFARFEGFYAHYSICQLNGNNTFTADRMGNQESMNINLVWVW